MLQWFFLTLIRVFDRQAKRNRRGPTSLDAFRKRAMKHICLIGTVVALINGSFAYFGQRYSEVFGLELPVLIFSAIGYLAVRRAHRVEWMAGIYMAMLATCISAWMLTTAMTSFSAVFVWYPLIGFGTILLCGRWIGMTVVALIFFESLAVQILNRQYGFVLTHGVDFPTTAATALATMVSAFFAGFAIMASVEVSRRRADQANRKANAINLKRASHSLLGDMAIDISRNMKTPLGALQEKLDEVMRWDSQDTLHNRGPILLQNLNQSLRELGRLNESLLLFSQTRGEHEIISLRAVVFLQHLNELTREKAIARGVSLDFSADQPQAPLHLPAAASLFALVSLVNKGVEAAAGQEPAWVRLQVRVYGKILQIRVSDSGPSLSYGERRAILEQTSQNSAWDVNLRLSLDFLAMVHGQLTLDPYSPDTCYVLRIPLSSAPLANNRAA